MMNFIFRNYLLAIFLINGNIFIISQDKNHLVEEVVKPHSALKNPMDESPRGLFGSVPQRFEKVVALVVLPSVEELHRLVEAAALGLIALVVFGSREAIRNREGSTGVAARKRCVKQSVGREVSVWEKRDGRKEGWIVGGEVSVSVEVAMEG